MRSDEDTKAEEEAPAGPEASGPAGATNEQPPGRGQRWTAARKRAVVLRLLRGEALDAVSREAGVSVARLEKWRDKALNGLEETLKDREGDPLQTELDTAHRRIGELSMEKELLEDKVRRLENGRPLGRRRSKK